MNNCYSEFLVEAVVQINSRKQSAEVIPIKKLFKKFAKPIGKYLRRNLF